MSESETTETPEPGITFDPNAVDQLTSERGICLEKDCHVRKYYKVLEECRKRVEAKPYTAETCHQETVDLIESIDHCASHKTFKRFK